MKSFFEWLNLNETSLNDLLDCIVANPQDEMAIFALSDMLEDTNFNGMVQLLHEAHWRQVEFDGDPQFLMTDDEWERVSSEDRHPPFVMSLQICFQDGRASRCESYIPEIIWGLLMRAGHVA